MLNGTKYIEFMDNAACCIGELAARAIEADDIASSEADCRFNQLFNATAKFQVLQGYFPEGQYEVEPSTVAELDLTSIDPITLNNDMSYTLTIGGVLVRTKLNLDGFGLSASQFAELVADDITFNVAGYNAFNTNGVITLVATNADVLGYIVSLDIQPFITYISQSTTAVSSTYGGLCYDSSGTYCYYTSGGVIYQMSGTTIIGSLDLSGTGQTIITSYISYCPNNNCLYLAITDVAFPTYYHLAIVQIATPFSTSTINFVALPDAAFGQIAKYPPVFNSFNNAFYIIGRSNASSPDNICWKVELDSVTTPTITASGTFTAVPMNSSAIQTPVVNPYTGVMMFGALANTDYSFFLETNFTLTPVGTSSIFYPLIHLGAGSGDTYFMSYSPGTSILSLYRTSLVTPDYSLPAYTSINPSLITLYGYSQSRKALIYANPTGLTSEYVLNFFNSNITTGFDASKTVAVVTPIRNLSYFIENPTNHDLMNEGLYQASVRYMFRMNNLDYAPFTTNFRRGEDGIIREAGINCITEAKAQTIMDSLKSDCTLCNCNSDYERTPDPTPTVDNPVNNFLVDDDGNIITDDEGNPIEIA